MGHNKVLDTFSADWCGLAPLLAGISYGAEIVMAGLTPLTFLNSKDRLRSCRQAQDILMKGTECDTWHHSFVIHRSSDTMQCNICRHGQESLDARAPVMSQVRRFVRVSALADHVRLLPPHVSKAATAASACPPGGVHRQSGAAAVPFKAPPLSTAYASVTNLPGSIQSCDLIQHCPRDPSSLLSSTFRLAIRSSPPSSSASWATLSAEYMPLVAHPNNFSNS